MKMNKINSKINKIKSQFKIFRIVIRDLKLVKIHFKKKIILVISLRIYKSWIRNMKLQIKIIIIKIMII